MRNIVVFPANPALFFYSQHCEGFISTAGKDAGQYRINTDFQNKPVNRYISACWPYREERMLAVGVVC